MSQVYPLSTDVDSARILQRMIAEQRGEEFTLSPSDLSAGNGAKVVKLRTAIAANSAVAVIADVMVLRGNTWAVSGQTIQVRSATGAAITTANRHIARPVANFGYCVVQT